MTTTSPKAISPNHAGSRQERHPVLQVCDPATGQPVGEVQIGGSAEVSAAVDAAREAAGGWARTPPADRGVWLAGAAARVRAAAAELATLTTTDMGKPGDDALGGVLAGAATLAQYAELGPLHRGRALQGGWGATDLMLAAPRGVVAAIVPWNDPVAVACGLVGAALVTGNTVVLKPSERATSSVVRLVEILQEGLPQGVLTVVSGDGSTGALLAASESVDVVAHVGSTATGRAIAAATAASGAKALLENGGNDALIVDAGVDPGWAAAQAAIGAFANAGQICTSVERIYVHAEVAAAFLDALVVEARAWSMGPLVDARLRDLVHGQVEEARALGATVLCGGEVPTGPGAFYPATVLAGCTEAMTVMREETFGPVAPVRVVASFEAALAAAADSSYGLAATVLTADMAHAQRAWRELPVGTVKVNAVFGGAPGGAAQPQRFSGAGFGYGPELLDEMTTTKVLHLAAPPAV